MRIFFLSTLVLLFIGCSAKSTVVLLDSGKVGSSVIVSTNKGSTRINKIDAYVNLNSTEEAPTAMKMMPKEEISQRFGKVLSAAPAKPLSYILYFKNGSTELTDESKKILEKSLKSIKERSPCIVDVIGHTDTTGSSSINQKVSLKRAKYIKSIILKRKIKVLSINEKGYGENDLLVKTDNNKANAKNRNVEVFIK